MARLSLPAPARRFPDQMVRAWIVHNIEEVGYLEHLLPGLHPQRGAAATASA